MNFMVTAGNGSMTWVGDSGRQYVYSFYSSDVVGAYITFSTTGLAVAGSQNFLLAPETMTLKDVSFTSSNTVSTAFTLEVGDQAAGIVLPIANVLTSVVGRGNLIPNVRISAGRKIAWKQA